MEIIRELRRFTSPFPQPQALYVDGPTLWMTSRLTRRLYAVDLASGRVTWETAVPGTATGWGITMKGGDLYVVCGTDATGIDDRVIRRCVPGQGFDPAFSWACPEGMGSHLSFTGESLVLSQWYPRKLVYFDPAGRVANSPLRTGSAAIASRPAPSGSRPPTRRRPTNTS